MLQMIRFHSTEHSWPFHSLYGSPYAHVDLVRSLTGLSNETAMTDFGEKRRRCDKTAGSGFSTPDGGASIRHDKVWRAPSRWLILACHSPNFCSIHTHRSTRNVEKRTLLDSHDVISNPKKFMQPVFEPWNIQLNDDENNHVIVQQQKSKLAIHSGSICPHWTGKRKGKLDTRHRQTDRLIHFLFVFLVLPWACHRLFVEIVVVSVFIFESPPLVNVRSQRAESPGQINTTLNHTVADVNEIWHGDLIS